jgi:alpha-amylase
MVTNQTIKLQQNQNNRKTSWFWRWRYQRNFSKIDEGYFDKLGINAIWFTPIVEQIHDGVDEELV